ncbi:MAG: leucine-rich repeat protein [Muribaculaceae bacterium]|nr:leucine-rich repeat protein [Muribaculaceae bacterium]
MSRKLLFKAFALVAALASALGANAYDFVEPGFYLNITGTNTVEITYNNSNPNYNSYTGNVSIPSTITHNGTTYTVTAIGNNAFRNCDGLTGVSIPNTVTKLGNFAFYECPSLTTINIPYGVTTLGWDALGKTGLISVYIPGSVTYMGSEMFYYCTSLRSVTLPESITYIDMRSFQGCTNLTRIVIPNGVTTIYSDAFKGCTSLQEVTIPRTTTTIKSGAFSGCTALTTVSCFATTPPSLYNDDVFTSEAYSNATLQVPSAVQSAYQAANGWKRFNNINGVNYDFVLNNLKYVITSSTTVKCVGPTVDPATGSWYIPGTACGYDVTEIGEDAFSNCSRITSITIGPKVTKISKRAFYNCSGLTGMSIPNSVIYIGDFAFSGCRGMTSLTIGSNVQEIRTAAFNNCSGLTSVVIPNSVTYVGGTAFASCTSLSSIVIGENCRFNDAIGWSMNIFLDCTSLSSITCLSKQAWAFEEPMFPESTYTTAELLVPGGSEASYRATNYWYKFSQIKGTYTLDEALNVEGGDLHFTTGGVYPWIVMVSDDDVPYAQSGNAGVSSTTSTLTATVTAVDGDILSFDFKAWGEGSSTIWDRCSFSINGVEQIACGAYQNEEWETYSVYLPAGVCTLEWSYTKDASVNPEGDYFAIKAVQLIAPASTRGDVNGDDSVNIADVTALIDYLLSGNASSINLNAADCNQDSSVNISDVTTLIDYLLSGSW